MVNVVAAIIKNNRQQVFIAKRNKNSKLGGKWEFPGGKIEDKETPEEALHREIFEELGIEIDIEELFTESVYEYEFGTIRLIAFLTTVKSGEIIAKEHSDIRWVSLDVLENYEFVPADVEIIRMIKKRRVFL